MPQTALVTGATGLLGSQVVLAFERAGWTAIGTGHTRASPPKTLKLDLCQASEIEHILDSTKPHVVVHCAAERFPDRVDANPSAARALNISATASLASACTARHILLLYISTDYVFAGAPGEAPYASTAAPAPTNLYGQTKLDGEAAALAAARSTGLAVVLRVPVLYGPVGAKGNKESAVNVLMDILQSAQPQPDGSVKTVAMDDWAQRYPTHTEDVGRVCVDVAATYLGKGDGERGSLPKILQFTSEDRLTKFEICQVLADVMGLPMGGLQANKQGNDPNASVQRPYDTHLSTEALRSVGVDVSTQDFKAWWRWQVKAYRK